MSDETVGIFDRAKLEKITERFCAGLIDRYERGALPLGLVVKSEVHGVETR